MAQDVLQIAIEDHRAGRLLKAEAGYLAALSSNPRDADALHWLGVLRFQAGDLASAVDLLERAVAQKNDDPAFFHNLGQAYQSADRKDSAIKAFTRAVALDAKAPEPLISLGMACLGRGLPSDAAAVVAAFRSAEAIGIDTADIHQRLGLAFLAGRRFIEAIASFNLALSKKENDATILYHLALAHRGACPTSNKPANFSSGRLSSSQPTGRPGAALGMLDAEAGKNLEAAGLFRRAIAANRDDLQAYRGLAHVLQAAGKTSESNLAMKQVERILSGGKATSSATGAADEPSKVAALEAHLTPSEAQSQIHFGMAVVMNIFPPAKLPGPAVTGLFDKYAPNFDEHLRKLGYRALKPSPKHLQTCGTANLWTSLTLAAAPAFADRCFDRWPALCPASICLPA